MIVDLRQQQLEAMGGAALFTRIARVRPSVALSSAAAARMLRLLDYLLAQIEMQQTEGQAGQGAEAAIEQALITVIGTALDWGCAGPSLPGR